jgi:hypothetical protein
MPVRLLTGVWRILSSPATCGQPLHHHECADVIFEEDLRVMIGVALERLDDSLYRCEGEEKA